MTFYASDPLYEAMGARCLLCYILGLLHSDIALLLSCSSFLTWKCLFYAIVPRKPFFIFFSFTQTYS